jgi:hypothetical protein
MKNVKLIIELIAISNTLSARERRLRGRRKTRSALTA